MQNLKFVKHAKLILQDVGKPFNCYHEAILTGGHNQELKSLLYYAPADKYMEFIYTPEKAPCQVILETGYCSYSDDVQKLFPNDKGLAEVKAKAYLGCKTQNGLKALISPKAVQNPSLILNLLKNSPSYQS